MTHIIVNSNDISLLPHCRPFLRVLSQAVQCSRYVPLSVGAQSDRRAAAPRSSPRSTESSSERAVIATTSSRLEPRQRARFVCVITLLQWYAPVMTPRHPCVGVNRDGVVAASMGLNHISEAWKVLPHLAFSSCPSPPPSFSTHPVSRTSALGLIKSAFICQCPAPPEHSPARQLQRPSEPADPSVRGT
jgi:hypothetical protein